jgi:hypothetical protein
MHNLSLYEPNRDIMAKEPGLLYALHKLNASDYPLLSPTILAIEPQQEQQQQQPGLSLYSDKVYYIITSHILTTNNPNSIKFSLLSLLYLTLPYLTFPSSSSFPSLPFCSLLRVNLFPTPQVATNISTAKTHTFYIKGMTNLTKHKVEETLVGVKGVISFLIDVHTHKAVVRTMTDPGM